MPLLGLNGFFGFLLDMCQNRMQSLYNNESLYNEKVKIISWPEQLVIRNVEKMTFHTAPLNTQYTQNPNITIGFGFFGVEHPPM